MVESIIMDSQRMSRAFALVTELYQNDIRKASGAWGLHHPLGVCELVMSLGADEDTCIGALFHDVAEDKGGEEMLSRIRAEFGERVETIVRDCSDTIPTDYSVKEPWMERKVKHLIHIKDGMIPESRLVLTADTLHNCRDHIRGFRANGMNWWNNFRANVYEDRERTPEIIAVSSMWYLRAKYECLVWASKNKLKNALLVELDDACNQLIDLNSHLFVKYISVFSYADAKMLEISDAGN